MTTSQTSPTSQTSQGQAASHRDDRNVETVVVGGGQAGLSVGYHLRRHGRPFVVLDEQQRVGDGWRQHWDSLRLYSPAVKDGLPGMAFPASRWTYPGKDDMADYLESYADRFSLPVHQGVRVRELSRAVDGYRLATTAGEYCAENVVLATGTFGRAPRIPEVADRLSPGIHQLHSSEYLRPDQLAEGAVLVVGASHSGADIAFEVGPHRPTVLAGPVRGEVPFEIEGRVAHTVMPALFFLASHLLTIRTPLGRKLRPDVRAHGGPLLRVKRRDLAEAGVELVEEKVVDVLDGRPVLESGRVVEATTVIWCTGFRTDFDWVRLPILAEDGWPAETRGVVDGYPGLYFAGLAFQFGFTSMLVGGAGRDAEYVVEHLVARSRARAASAEVSA